MSTQVFISYSRGDTPWVLAFAQALKKLDVSVWLDQWRIKAGEPIRDAIEQGLRESDAIVAVVSLENVRSPGLFFELGVALGTGKSLIPIVSDDLPDAEIPYALRQRRFLHKGLPEDAAREVVTAVRREDHVLRVAEPSP